MKRNLGELLDVYRYQPPEVRDNAMVFIKTDKGYVQIVNSSRDLFDGQEALFLEPYVELKATKRVSEIENK